MNFHGDLADVCDMLRGGIRPRDRLTVSEWSDRNRKLTSEQSSMPGDWRTDANPLLREIMDFFSKHNRTHEMVVMKPSQVGVSEAITNCMGYGMEHNPGPMMVLLPTEQKRDDWKAQKLDPMLRDSPAVTRVVGRLRSRDAANRKDRVDFPGGSLLMAGGNSPSSYDQVSIRDMIMDDLDRFPEVIGKGHDPVARARGRCKAFPHKYKLALISTPTIKDASLIEREYKTSDQRRPYVPCPSCGQYQHLKWSNLQYDKVNNPPKAAWYECEHCGFQINEHHKMTMLRAGRWIPQNTGHPRLGYGGWSALYAPPGLGPSWLDMAVKWNEIHHDPATGKSRAPDQALLMAFINEDLGEVWEDQSSAIKAHDLAKRMEDFDMATIPPGVLALTVGIDTQDTWLDVTLIGWRPWQDGRPAWTTLDWFQIQGDTSKRGPWDELESYLNKEWTNAYGRTLRPRAAGIDNRGHRGEHVKAFIQRTTLKIPVYRVQGSTTLMSEFIATTAREQEKGINGKRINGAYGIWNVGTEAIKDMIYSALSSDADLPQEERRIRFAGGLPTDYFNGLLSEVKNPKTKRYDQKRGAEFKRNEPLDGMVYGIAIGHHKEVMIGMRRARIHREGGRSVMMTVPDPRQWSRLAALLEKDGADMERPGGVGKPPAAPEAPAARARPQLPRRVGAGLRR